MPDVTAGRRRGGGLAVAPKVTAATHRWLAHCRSSIDSAGMTIRTAQSNRLESYPVVVVESVRLLRPAVLDPGYRSQPQASLWHSTTSRDPGCEGPVAARFAELRTHSLQTIQRIETTDPISRSREVLQATCHRMNSRPLAVDPKECNGASLALDTAGRMPFAPERRVQANSSRPSRSD